jgi:uncharacterized RDD family membrane protein YckC
VSGSERNGMATPPGDTPQPPTPPAYGYIGPVARMPIPGNAELAIFVLVWFVIFLLWVISDAVGATLFAILTVVLTFGYMLSRGIAKASRVLEQ